MSEQLKLKKNVEQACTECAAAESAAEARYNGLSEEAKEFVLAECGFCFTDEMVRAKIELPDGDDYSEDALKALRKVKKKIEENMKELNECLHRKDMPPGNETDKRRIHNT